MDQQSIGNVIQITAQDVCDLPLPDNQDIEATVVCLMSGMSRLEYAIWKLAERRGLDLSHPVKQWSDPVKMCYFLTNGE